MTTVIVEPGEPFELALRRFKKQCEKAGKALVARKRARRRERFAD